MAIHDLFSKRQKKQQGEVPDVYVHDEMPESLKIQIAHIWKRTIEKEQHRYNHGYPYLGYQYVVETLCQEYGKFTLYGKPERGYRQYREELIDFLLNETDINKCIDVIEVSFKYIDNKYRNWRRSSYHYDHRDAMSSNDAIQELNGRFKEHGVGYEFQDSQIIRVDSAFIHSEVVIPALVLLRQPEYAGAQDEFLKAYKHYQKGNLEEAITACTKAFESTMKSICKKKDWKCAGADGAKGLLDICLQNQLIEPFWESQMNALTQLLAGTSTPRNKYGAHGQGPTPQDVPDAVVRYALHMTAAAILLLAESAE